MEHTFEQIEEEIQTILDSFGDVEIGEAHATGEELSQEQMSALDAYLEELAAEEKTKADGFAQFLIMGAGDAEKLRKESARLAARARSKENTMKYLKMKYLAIMELHGVKKIQGDLYTMSRRATKVCVIDDEKQVPDEWCKIETTRTPVKRDILFAMKTGSEIPGCRIGESVSLVVR